MNNIEIDMRKNMELYMDAEWCEARYKRDLILSLSPAILITSTSPLSASSRTSN